MLWYDTKAYCCSEKKYLEELSPVEEKLAKPEKVEIVREAEPSRFEPLHIKVKRQRSVIVELDTPRHLEIDGFIKGAKKNYMRQAQMWS